MRDLWDWIRGFRVVAGGVSDSAAEATQNVLNHMESRKQKHGHDLVYIKEYNKQWWWTIKHRGRR